MKKEEKLREIGKCDICHEGKMTVFTSERRGRVGIILSKLRADMFKKVSRKLSGLKDFE